MHLNPITGAWNFYGPFLASLRRATNSSSPHDVIDAVVRRARSSQQAQYRQLATWSHRWLAATRATQISARATSWTRGDLTVALRSLTGLRQPDGGTDVVPPCMREPGLTGETAGLALRILEESVATSGRVCRPVVLNVRQAQSYRLRRSSNRNDLDAYLHAEVAKHVAHWRAAA